MKTNTKAIAWIGLSVALLILVNRCGKHDSEHRENAAHSGEVHWGYEGEVRPDSWGELSPDFVTCAEGKAQSPVDLVAVATQALPEIVFNYEPTTLNLVNNGHTIQANYGAGSSIEVSGAVYELRQFHFHAPSEHTVKGQHFALELHLVHQDSDGGLAVIGVLIESGNHNEAFASVWEHLPTRAGQEFFVKDATVDADDLLPAERKYYRYEGSLTTPPCTEGVKWLVLQSSIQMSDAQIAAFEKIFKNNNRPVQPLNGRSVVRSVSAN